MTREQWLFRDSVLLFNFLPADKSSKDYSLFRRWQSINKRENKAVGCPTHSHSGKARKIQERSETSVCVCICVLDCVGLCNFMDYSPPGSSVYGILQARILERVAIFYSRGIFPAQGLNLRLSASPALAGGIFTSVPPGKPRLLFRTNPNSTQPVKSIQKFFGRSAFMDAPGCPPQLKTPRKEHVGRQSLTRLVFKAVNNTAKTSALFSFIFSFPPSSSPH